MTALQRVVAASFLIAASAPQPISDREFEQLMRAVVKVAAERSQIQPTTTTICINSKLAPPTSHSKEWMEGMPTNGELPEVLRERGFNTSVRQTVRPTLVAAKQTRMPSLPARFVMISRGTVPRACVIDHAPSGGDNSAVTLTFTRPVFANGYAFIDEFEDCPGLCGTTFLRVFRKKNGKWTQVSLAIPSVS